MDLSELKEKAKVKGYQIHRSFPGNNQLAILSRTTGKLVGKYSEEELAQVVETLDPVNEEPVKVEHVGWSVIAQLTPEVPRFCPTGGSDCLCQDHTLPLWLCAVSTCHNQAGCGGACSDHYGELKIIDDFTPAAMRHTDAHLADGTYDEILIAWEQGQRSHVSLKAGGMIAAPPPPHYSRVTSHDLAALGWPPGISVRQVGANGERWILVDRDGNVLAEDTDPVELVRQFTEE